ncbi:TetR/AcrR family transcriptional regulator [Nocardioides zeae]|uniref:TetR/AcrR family transcriptional regulator n=1 Tax=Nocardioides zeae TaxID=1457234 RepID=UPI00286C7D32|nr:TetR/AcrR family transcriptional regulator [Nocardioides zeae]
MPKVVDAEQRRREVLDAVWRVVERDGIAGATVRAIALEAGASTAVVTHWFRNKDEVLRAALDLSHHRIAARRQRHLEGRTGRDALTEALRQMLPLDAERKLEMQIEITVWLRALTDDSSREVHLGSHDRSLRLLERLVEESMAAGELDASLDPRRTAEGLLAFVDGLGVDALVHPDRVSEERQLELLEDHLDRLAPASRGGAGS